MLENDIRASDAWWGRWAVGAVGPLCTGLTGLTGYRPSSFSRRIYNGASLMWGTAAWYFVRSTNSTSIRRDSVNTTGMAKDWFYAIWVQLPIRRIGYWRRRCTERYTERCTER